MISITLYVTITADNIIPRNREATIGDIGNVYRQSPGGFSLRIGEEPVALSEGQNLGSWNNVTSYYEGRYQVIKVSDTGSARVRHIAAD